MRTLSLLLLAVVGCDAPAAILDTDGALDVDAARAPDLDPAADLAPGDGGVDALRPRADLEIVAPDAARAADLALPCGVNGTKCCASSVCNDGSFCSSGWCQSACGLDGKPACDAAEGPCAKGLLEVGDQAVELGQQGWACGKAPQRCVAAANCGYIGEPCCAGGCYAGDGMNIPGGYCHRDGTCTTCSTAP